MPDRQRALFYGVEPPVIILGGDGAGIDPVKTREPDGEVVVFDRSPADSHAFNPARPSAAEKGGC